ncbi:MULTISPECIES: molecular chaperone HtpG [Prauserella salsuginis group]|uniref:Chaperone protein HtpG n=2 Tax=Prauserella salsuginis group TaxID=2893672 RepID=A0A839XPY9_9PSEU|nr:MULTISPECIES: molecular chaperone HtpG [Prauserella salsuginis group]MBB3665300.1 molecular chaperone HtpG [Prauserella sediminis]MCR3723065.1 molecular chaperone HtpG [Prauserella flava]MCR3732560.1 molecular chaperone HtpG [Prauserella salsuginis]
MAEQAVESEQQAETHEFQAEARQLLRLMVHSIYSDKDVFLRELLSNSSDALDKLRLESLVDKDLDVDTEDLHIQLERDPAARTLTVRDNGIGMSHDEVVGLIGTIARSGTAELLEKLKSAQETQGSDLIGQFGVGFYSAFMVADRVTVVTRKAGETVGTRWESEGEATYTIADVPDAPQGTAVTLHLKPVDTDDGMHDYTDTGVLRRIVTRYSDFLAWPIRMEVERVKKGEDGESDETVVEPETLNSMKALWARPRSEVTDAEYHEFYKHISHDWADPLETMRLQAEGTFEYQALLFLPSRAPFDLFTREAKRGVQLYVKRVFIMDDCEELMPEYLRFVKGVVDAQDLSLNVSREILQQDRQIRAMRRRLAKKVLSTVAGLVKSEESEDRDKYRTFWSQFGTCVKEGLVTDPDSRQDILDIASFDSTRSADEQTTLAEYIERMPEGQEHIYYLTGRSREMVEKSPHMEAFTSKGIEVLILTDQVDEMWVDSGAEFQGKTFRSIAKGEVDLDGDGEGDDSTDEATKEQFAGLLEWLRETLSDEVKDVRLSSRLTTSPACIVGDEGDLSPELVRIYRQLGQPLPDVKRILEINPEHALVTGLRESHATNADDPSLPEVAQLLYGTTLLAEGEELPDPHRFAQLLAGRLAAGLG